MVKVLELLLLPPFVVFTLLATYNLIVCRSPNAKSVGSKNVNPKRVSVYVPVFNDRSVLESVAALAKIHYPSYEVKILDDSTDESLSKAIRELIGKHPNFSVVARRGREGFKGGAINNALRSEKSEYVCILDCDFRPPRDFLAKLVEQLEQEGADIVQGYQRHSRGSERLFGLFYRAASATSISFLFGRYKFGLAPIFYGSCALIRTEVARKVGFNSGSFDEDLDFSVRAYSEGNLKCVVCPDIFADGACPKTFGAFVKQQIRWTELSIRNIFRRNFLRILTGKMSLRQKVDLYMQGLIFTPGFFLLWSLLGTLIGVLFLDASWSISHLSPIAYFALGFAYPLWVGARFEGYGFKSRIKALLIGFLLIYVMCPVMSFAFLRGIFSKGGQFLVTAKC